MICGFFLRCGSPVNFRIPSVNILEVAKFQAGLLCSCRVERIDPILGANYMFRRLISFSTE
jgi:hypothetical protein